MVGVAVKFTVVPAHTVLAEAVIDTLTGNIGFTVMVSVFDVAGPPLWQVSEEVITTFTTFPFVGT